MIQKLFIVLVFLLLLAGCGRNKPVTQVSSPNDTAQSESPVVVAQLLSYEERQGMHLYKKYCMVCHGESGKGDGFNAFNLDPRPRNFTDARYMNSLSNERLLETVNQGGRGVNKSPLMPSWGHRLSKSEMEYVITYVRYLTKAGQQQP
ncbi:MAG: c-type cytochrome [Ignavibacteriales bacterium]|nr:c-type cytochrome [Ignavibacteriales bacterium]